MPFHVTRYLSAPIICGFRGITHEYQSGYRFILAIALWRLCLFRTVTILNVYRDRTPATNVAPTESTTTKNKEIQPLENECDSLPSSQTSLVKMGARMESACIRAPIDTPGEVEPDEFRMFGICQCRRPFCGSPG